MFIVGCWRENQIKKKNSFEIKVSVNNKYKFSV